MPTVVTKTVKSSGGNYSSLSAWEAGEQGNLVTADEIREAECYSFQDTTQVLINGSTTDSTRYMRIFTPTSERHDGKYNTSKYRLELSDQHAMMLGDAYVRVEGIQVKVTLATNSVHHITAIMGLWNFALASGTSQRVSHCVVVCDATGRTDNSNLRGFFIEAGASSTAPVPILYVWNCMVLHIGSGAGYNDHKGFHCGGQDGDMVVYNCTADDFDFGYHKAGSNTSFLVKNCLASNSSIGFNANGSSFAAGSDYNVTTDATSPPGSNSDTSSTVSFVDSANGDFHLLSSDTGAKDQGVDLSSDPTLAFSTDIDGQTRSGTWDVGADEVVSDSSFPRRWATAA